MGLAVVFCFAKPAQFLFKDLIKRDPPESFVGDSLYGLFRFLGQFSVFSHAYRGASNPWGL